MLFAIIVYGILAMVFHSLVAWLDRKIYEERRKTAWVLSQQTIPPTSPTPTSPTSPPAADRLAQTPAGPAQPVEGPLHRRGRGHEVPHPAGRLRSWR